MKTTINIPIAITNEVTEFEVAIKNWHHGGNKSMAHVYAADRKALRGVLSAFKKGKMKEAKSLTYRLDTIVRDVIPHSVHRLLDV